VKSSDDIATTMSECAIRVTSVLFFSRNIFEKGAAEYGEVGSGDEMLGSIQAQEVVLKSLEALALE
jgi:hypothetical protein